MTQEKISLSSPTEGPWAAPFSTPNLGMYDQLRNLQAVYPGQAVSFKASTDPLDFLSIYLFGHSLARPEFGGVVTTYGNSPSNLNAISTTNSDTVSIIKPGRACIMLAPGEVVERDQYLEPIPSGAYQGCWRVAASPASAHAQAMQPKDDSANADGDLPGPIITAMILERPASSGLVGGRAVGPSNTLTSTTSETVYTIGSPAVQMTRTIPANSSKVGDRYRIVASGRAANGASGATIFKGYLNSVAGTPEVASLFWTSISTTPSSGDVWQIVAELYINALSGSNNVSLGGSVVVGAPGTATARAIGIFATMDVTEDNNVTFSCTPNNSADQSVMTFLSVEKV